METFVAIWVILAVVVLFWTIYLLRPKPAPKPLAEVLRFNVPSNYKEVPVVRTTSNYNEAGFKYNEAGIAARYSKPNSRTAYNNHVNNVNVVNQPDTSLLDIAVAAAILDSVDSNSSESSKSYYYETVYTPPDNSSSSSSYSSSSDSSSSYGSGSSSSSDW